MSIVLGIAAACFLAWLVKTYIRGKKRLQAKARQAMENAFQVPEGSNHRSVYVYDGSAFKRKRVGERFRVLVLKGEKTMTSIYTGMTWTGDCCLSYNGERIGFLGMGISHDFMSRLVDKRGSASIVVHVRGYDASAGFPYVVADLPELDWFRKVLCRR